MTKPNTFIIGAPKCGTTALAYYLSARSDVFFSKPKEPLYWCDDLGIEPHALRARNLQEYLRLFASADGSKHKVIAEGTTSYLRSRKAVRSILEFNPEAKFIAMLRNPVEVVQAFHMEQLYTTFEKEKDFTKAWEDQDRRERDYDSRSDPNQADSLLYRRIASFLPQVERLFELVPPEQRLIIIYDDFRHDPRATYLRVLNFLGLEDDGRVEFEPVNAAHAQRFPWLAAWIYNPPSPYLRRFLTAVRLRLVQRDQSRLIRGLKNFLNTSKDREEIGSSTRMELEMQFQNEITMLESLLQVDLKSWRSRQ